MLHTARINIRTSGVFKEKVEKAAESRGESITDYTIEALTRQMERDFVCKCQ